MRRSAGTGKPFAWARYCAATGEIAGKPGFCAGIPFGREYRVFLHQQRVLGWGYYWEGNDPLKPLTREEARLVLQLAQEAARRVGTPFLAVDIGQKENGAWIVIETGDAQFSGVSQTPLLALWNAIRSIGARDEDEEEETTT